MFMFIYIQGFLGDYVYEKLKFEYKPFYIGKGKNNRYLDHLKIVENNIKLPYNAKRYYIIKDIIYSDLKPIIMKIDKNLSEQNSLILEEKYIRIIVFGRLKIY